MENKKLLVVSGHAADFVWRGGGTIAKYIQMGWEVKLIILSFGVRGESNDLWKQGNQTYESVAEIRKAEALKAAEILGVTDLYCWNLVDYHMEFTQEHVQKLVEIIREFNPNHILTHAEGDAFNPDHEYISRKVFEASVLANSSGVEVDDLGASTQQRIFGFEPHQPEISNFTPDVIIDITSTYDLKRKAMECFVAQSHLIEYYSARAMMRGNHARRISGKKEYKFAEAFTRRFPYVGREFV